MDVMQWTEIHCNQHHHNPHHISHQQAASHHHHLAQGGPHHLHHHHPLNHPLNHHVHPNYNHHLNHHHPINQDHHLSSAPTIKNHSVTHFGGYLYCFGGYDGRRNHMTLLIYSIAEQRWIRPVVTNNTSSVGPGAGPQGGLASVQADHYPSPNAPSGASSMVHPQNDHPHAGAYQQHQQHSLQQHHNMHGGGMNGAGNGNGAGDLMDGPFGINPNNQDNPNNAGSNSSNNNPSAPSNPISPTSPIWVTGTPPPGRNGHSATLVTDDDDEEDGNHPESGRIIVLGGWLGTGPLAASDMHILDISRGGRQLRWYQPAVKGTPPGPCNMHSADYVRSQKSVYVFRGGNGREYLNDLHALHVDTLQWRRVETTGAIPQQRANHSSAILNEELIIFGGWNGRERLNDIHILDTTTGTWTCPHVGGVLPHPRAGMTLTALRGRLYLFGGSGTSAKCFQDLQILDRQQMAWLDVSTEQDQLKATGGSSVVVPPPPAHRYEEDVVPHHRYGGSAYDRSPGYGGVMNQQYDESGAQPYGNFNDQNPGDDNHHSLRSMGDRYGGATSGGSSPMVGNRSDPWRSRPRHQNQVSVINPNDEDSVPSVLVQGRGPGRRAGHTATAVNRYIYCFGGSCGSDYLNDFFVLDTDPPPQAVVTESNSLKLMERRLRHFFNDEEFADVTFVVQGQRVYGHKMVLSIVSDCFRAMFSAGFRESAEMEIVIPDCSHAAFLAVMEYIYTGSLPKSLGLDINTSTSYSHHESQEQPQQPQQVPQPPSILSSPRSISSESSSSAGGGGGNGSVNSSCIMDSSQLSRLVELLELADRFFLDHLKQVCETLLRNAVNADTVEYLTSVAQKTNANQLHEICKHFARNRE
ncbi:hypothetical protein ACA910_005253 [Epithemia clementina (nom. ined.)]